MAVNVRTRAPSAIDGPDLEITEYVACLEKRRNLRMVLEFFRIAAESATTTGPSERLTAKGGRARVSKRTVR